MDPPHNRALNSQLSRSGSSSSADSLVGHRVGPYVIRGLIARGGMGAVYEAWHERLQRTVALKTLLPGQMATAEEVQRFLNEARAVAKLDHPNIVPVYDVGEAAGVKYLAMELVRGDSLFEVIKKEGKLEPDHALRIVAHSALGLQHAHEQGILHRDLKPANILIQHKDGIPRLTDFGVAKAVGNQRLTATGTALGTPNYMSPEQAMGQNRDLDARSDVYGLGAILYECLTGLPPFNKSSQLLTMQAVVNEELVSPKAHVSDLDQKVEAICLKCMRKDRDARYESAQDLVDDITRYLRGDTIIARAAGPMSRLGRSLRRNGITVSALGAVAMASAALSLLVVLPWLQVRDKSRLEERAAELRAERVAEARAALEANADAARLLELAERLDYSAVESDALAELVPGGDPLRARAVRRGLGGRDEHKDEVGPAVAELRARLASGLPVGSPERLLALAEAGAADPEGRVGRASRLEIARALRDRQEPRSRRLAVAELEELAREDDREGLEAMLELARARADAFAFAEAGQLYGVVEAAVVRTGLPPTRAEEARRLGNLMRELSPLVEVSPHALTRVRSDAEIRLVGRDQSDLSVFTVRPEASEPLESTGDWRVGAWRPYRSAAGDWDGDGQEELFLASSLSGKHRVWLVPVFSGRNGTPRRSLLQVEQGRVQGLAPGDFDGDGNLDLAVLCWDVGNASRVLLGRGGGAPKEVDLFPRGPGDPHYPFGLSAICAVDLDGDGRDEVVVTPSEFGDGRVDVLSLGDDGRFTSLGKVAVGFARRVVGFESDGPGAAVVTVDYADERFHPLPGAPPWVGRDGLYVIRLVDGAPTLAARWTYGEDEAPSRVSRLATGSVGALCATIGGEDWAVRAARRQDGAWRLEMVPLDRLAFETNARAELTLSSLDPPASGRLEAMDLDRDGQAELLIGERLLGLGAVTPPASRPAREPIGRAEWLLRAARNLQALGLGAEAEGTFLAELAAAHPDSWAARTARLGEVDALLGRARHARARARSAFRNLAPERGRELWAEANDGLRRAAELADRLAQVGGDADRALVGAKASFAWSELGEWRMARASVERALALSDLGLDQEERLRDELRAIEAVGDLERIELDMGSEAVRPQLGVQRPLRTRFVDEGVTIRCSPDTRDAVLAPITCDSPYPLEFEADVEVHGHAWSTTVQVGLLEQKLTGGGGYQLTGFELNLWDNANQMLGVRLKVGGEDEGVLLRLPSFATRLVLRLELRPLAGGGLLMEASISHPREGLIYAVRKKTSRLSLPSQLGRYAGIFSPAAKNYDSASLEQSHWSMETSATLRRVDVRAAGAKLVGLGSHAWRANTLMALGRDDEARQAYEGALKRSGWSSEPAYSLINLAILKGRAGDPSGVQDLVSAARRYPLFTLFQLEDMAESLLDGEHPEDLVTVSRALAAMARDTDTPVRTIGRQLSGDLSAFGDPNKATTSRGQIALCYLAMRNVRDSSRVASYRSAYRRIYPTGRYPRSNYPQVIDVPNRELSDAQVEALLVRDGAKDRQERYRMLQRARAARPRASKPLLELGRHYYHGRHYGMAEHMFREARRREPDDQGAAALWLVYALRARSQWGEMLEALEDAVAAGVTLNETRQREFGEVVGHDPRFKALLGNRDRGD